MLKKIDCCNFNTIYMTKSIEAIYKTFFLIRMEIAMKIKVGEIIKAKREELKIPLVNFAKELDISPGYLSQIENGIKTNPNLDIILKIIHRL
ncbi:MAG: helix-turn-helix transcriptional regulator, partial [Ruminiclostridium sp.]|nr:helix-turn-helix transcriptional regulator [Ruminiclostridium sp.]